MLGVPFFLRWLWVYDARMEAERAWRVWCEGGFEDKAVEGGGRRGGRKEMREE